MWPRMRALHYYASHRAVPILNTGTIPFFSVFLSVRVDPRKRIPTDFRLSIYLCNPSRRTPDVIDTFVPSKFNEQLIYRFPQSCCFYSTGYKMENIYYICYTLFIAMESFSQCNVHQRTCMAIIIELYCKIKINCVPVPRTGVLHNNLQTPMTYMWSCLSLALYCSLKLGNECRAPAIDSVLQPAVL